MRVGAPVQGTAKAVPQYRWQYRTKVDFAHRLLAPWIVTAGYNGSAAAEVLEEFLRSGLPYDSKRP